MINMEEYKDLIDDIRRMSDEEKRNERKVLSEISISGSNVGDVCKHGNSYASNCSDCDEEVIEETEYLEWYEKWKKENFNNEKK